MLFHSTHTHTPENCPAMDPQKVRNTWGKALAASQEQGIPLVGAWVDAAAHIIYAVVETDSAEKLEKLLDPLMMMGTADTRPVVNGLPDYRRRAGEPASPSPK